MFTCQQCTYHALTTYISVPDTGGSEEPVFERFNCTCKDVLINIVGVSCCESHNAL